MADINILIAVDTDTLIKQSLSMNPDNPTNVGDGSIFAIVSAEDVYSGQAGAELNVKARTRDNILWQMTSLTLNADYCTIPYELQVSQGSNLLKDDGASLADVTTPLPDPDHPLTPGLQNIKSYYWQAQVMKEGTATYRFKFMIMDRDCKPQGYCTWDPFITIQH